MTLIADNDAADPVPHPDDHSLHGTFYNSRPITEVGLSWIDTRDFGGNSPGYRGHHLHKKMKSIHIIVNEYRDHWGDHCKAHWHDTAPYSFAFGKSSFVPESEVIDRLRRKFRDICLIGISKADKKAGRERNIAFLTWDCSLERRVLAEWKLNWWDQDNVYAYDLQRHFLLEYKHGREKAGCPKTMYALGLRYTDGRPREFKKSNTKSIAHNAANDSAFEIQIFLALRYLTDAECDDRASIWMQSIGLRHLVELTLLSAQALLTAPFVVTSLNPAAPQEFEGGKKRKRSNHW
ncbi:anion exchange family [Fusarium longipes]|uniref:Anion exchange family n=1 Tax=Fusarium longipes TaxID=694270 RepID=A0A395T3Q6_9HYPO|nr:anion exchange family [Fusarium longipes]